MEIVIDTNLTEKEWREIMKLASKHFQDPDKYITYGPKDFKRLKARRGA